MPLMSNREGVEIEKDILFQSKVRRPAKNGISIAFEEKSCEP